MIRRIFLLLLLTAASYAQPLKLGEAKGAFLSIAIGPRFPIGSFSDNQSIGVGVDLALSYTDNNFLPLFFFGKLGYQHYPGKQNFYKNSDYSSFSSNVILLQFGGRYFFPPIVENIVLLMPILEGGVSLAFYEKLHQYKQGSGNQNFVEEVTKTGFNIGFGFSMFLLDVVANYNYFENNQYISFDMKVRIPVYAIF
jgi:hypothetical protein